MGELFVNHYLALKRKESDRFTEFVKANGLDPTSEEVTDWEQNEYFDFF
jgi:glutamine synthetase